MSPFTIESIDGVSIAHVDQDVDAANVGVIQRQLADALGPATSSLVIDLQRARYVDSAGIDMLLRLSGRLEHRRAKLILFIPAISQLRRLAAIVGLSEAVAIYPTLDAALRAAPELQRRPPPGDMGLSKADTGTAGAGAGGAPAELRPAQSEQRGLWPSAPSSLLSVASETSPRARLLQGCDAVDRSVGELTSQVGVRDPSGPAVKDCVHPRFSVNVTGGDDAATIALSGEADMLAAPQIEAAFKDVAAGEAKLVLIDLHGLTFIDSSGVHVLLTGHERCQARGQLLRIVPGPANVQRLFEITGIDEVLPFCEAGHVEGSSPGGGVAGEG